MTTRSDLTVATLQGLILEGLTATGDLKYRLKGLYRGL
jgi:hypothetical protein